MRERIKKGGKSKAEEGELRQRKVKIRKGE